MDVLHQLQNWDFRLGLFLLAAVMIRQAMSMPFTRYCPLEAAPHEAARWEDPCGGGVGVGERLATLISADVDEVLFNLDNLDTHLQLLQGQMADLASFHASYRYSPAHFNMIKEEMETFQLKGMPERPHNSLNLSAVMGDAYVDLSTVTYFLTVFHRNHDVELYRSLQSLTYQTMRVLCMLAQTMTLTPTQESRLRQLASMQIPCTEYDDEQLHKREYVMLRDSLEVVNMTKRDLLTYNQHLNELKVFCVNRPSSQYCQEK